MAQNNDSDRYRYIRDHQKHSSFIFTWAIWWTDQSRLNKTSYLATVSLAICSIAYFSGLFFLVPICLSAVTLLWGVLETLGSDIKNSIKTAEELDQEFQNEFDIEKGNLKQNIQNQKELKQEKDSLPLIPKDEIDSGIKKQEANIEDKKQFLDVKDQKSSLLIDKIEKSTTNVSNFAKKIDNFNNKVDEKSKQLDAEIIIIQDDTKKIIEEHQVYSDEIAEKEAKKIDELKSFKLKSNGKSKLLGSKIIRIQNDTKKIIEKHQVFSEELAEKKTESLNRLKALKLKYSSHDKNTYFPSVDVQKIGDEQSITNENNFVGQKFI